MLGTYFRILLTIAAISFVYIGGMYSFPETATKIDTTLGININENIILKVKEILQKSQQTGDALNNKLNNPAPNSSKKIEEMRKNAEYLSE